jgi:hypothetical protein
VYLNQTQGSYVGCNNKIYGNGMNDYTHYPRGIVANGPQKPWAGTPPLGNLISDNVANDLEVAVQTQYSNPTLSVACNQLKKQLCGFRR